MDYCFGISVSSYCIVADGLVPFIFIPINYTFRESILIELLRFIVVDEMH